MKSVRTERSLCSMVSRHAVFRHRQARCAETILWEVVISASIARDVVEGRALALPKGSILCYVASQDERHIETDERSAPEIRSTKRALCASIWHMGPQDNRESPL